MLKVMLPQQGCDQPLRGSASPARQCPCRLSPTCLSSFSQPDLSIWSELPRQTGAPLNALASRGDAPGLQDTRQLFSSTLFRVATPVREVTWADFLLADVLTSLAKALSDSERAICLLVSHGSILEPHDRDEVSRPLSQPQAVPLCSDSHRPCLSARSIAPASNSNSRTCATAGHDPRCRQGGVPSQL